MAEIPVEKKSGSLWWMWLVGLLVLLVVIWFVWQMFDRDRGRVNTTDPATVTGTATTTTPTSATGAVQPGGTAAGDRVTDAGAYASTSDKRSLIGREAVFPTSAWYGSWGRNPSRWPRAAKSFWS